MRLRRRLPTRFYRKRVVKSAKVYSRKDKVKAIEDEEAK
jgi:hypothetical protein